MEGGISGSGSGSANALNIHSLSSFITAYDGSYPVQDFIQELQEAAHLGSWPDIITLKVAKLKLQGAVADIVRNRHDLNHANTFPDFSARLVSALHTDRPVSVRLQDLMTCVQQPIETVDAYATRIRQKAKGLTEWDVSAETQELKNKTVTATFIKGLQPHIRQHVLPFNPPDFEAAITLARGQELSQSLMPSDQFAHVASAANSPKLVDSSMLDIQKRVASLDLATAEQSSDRGRGRFQARGRGRGRQPPRHSFPQQPRFRQSRSWTQSQYRAQRSDDFDAHRPSNSSNSCCSCHCRCSTNDRYRSHSRHYDRRTPSHSPSHRSRTFRRNSRSPYRDVRDERRRVSRSPSASPSRSRYQSPKGYRSRH